MKSASLSLPAQSYTERLWQFARYVLVPAVPRLAWWVLGLLAFSSLNLLLQRELWPHYPRAETWLIFLLVVGLALLPWLAAYTAQRLMSRVEHWWWRVWWWLVAAGAYLGAAFSSVILLIWALVNLW